VLRRRRAVADEAAREQIDFADASESPTWRTYPAFTMSAMAPIVSSIGTAGSSRAG
jgi:hypothetical protein